MPKANPKLHDEKWLREQYLVKQRTYEDIAKDANATKYGVYHAMRRYNIKARTHTSKYPELNDKEWLQKMYVDESLSTKQIADLIGSTIGNVGSALVSMGIKLRSAKEGWHTRFPDGRWGEQTSNWRGGISDENARIRSTEEYKIWLKAVLERDNYTCQECHKRGGDLEVHHIKPFAYFPELRFVLSNGRTLCGDCHKKTNSYRRPRKKNDPEFGIQ